MGSQSAEESRGPALRAATGAAVLIVLGVLVGLGLVGRVYGREPGPAWACDDTRFTQLVPRGRGVVGPPVSPAPGCLR
jgi:hypothetical protein